ncbi:MAG TPA: response regulator [Stellaceae bacterium]|nr:response regulator [Stellaceae bacterium]
MNRILVVDDHEVFRSYVATLLERAGYEVFELPDGGRVGALVSETSFAAIVTDLFMPRADGLEVVRLIKSIAPSVPVIGMTGNHTSLEHTCARAMSAFGADAVLSKPLDAALLLATLQRLICGTQKSAAPESDHSTQG